MTTPQNPSPMVNLSKCRFVVSLSWSPLRVGLSFDKLRMSGWGRFKGKPEPFMVSLSRTPLMVSLSRTPLMVSLSRTPLMVSLSNHKLRMSGSGGEPVETTAHGEPVEPTYSMEQ
jgi:hypothetical protein